MARWDLLRVICTVASRISKWDASCDRALHRLSCFVHSMVLVQLVGRVGDGPEELNLAVYADANFAGCPGTNRSTSGVLLVLIGPNSFCSRLRRSRSASRACCPRRPRPGWARLPPRSGSSACRPRTRGPACSGGPCRSSCARTIPPACLSSRRARARPPATSGGRTVCRARGSTRSCKTPRATPR